MKPASKFEIVAARIWNVLNEGKSFHPVFVLGTFLLLHALPAHQPGVLGPGAAGARPGNAPLILLFVRLRLPAQAPVGTVGLSRRVRPGLPLRGPRGAGPGPGALRLLYGLFLGDVLLSPADRGAEDELRPVLAARAGEPRLDQRQLPGAGAEGPDRTLFTLEYLISGPNSLTGRPRRARARLHDRRWRSRAYLIHRFLLRLETRLSGGAYTQDVNRGTPLAKRVIVVVIDGCRLDRFHEAEKPYLEKKMSGGNRLRERRDDLPGPDGGLLLLDVHRGRAGAARHHLQPGPQARVERREHLRGAAAGGEERAGSSG